MFTGSANLLDSVAARADAVKIAEDIRPYAVLNGPLLGTAFADELARGACSACCASSAASNAFYADHAPYVWSLQTTPEQVAAHVAEYVTSAWPGGSGFAGRRTAAVAAAVRADQRQRPVRRGRSGPVDHPQLHAAASSSPTTWPTATPTGSTRCRPAHRPAKGTGASPRHLRRRPHRHGVADGRGHAAGWFPEWVMTGGFSSERSSWGRRSDPARWPTPSGSPRSHPRPPRPRTTSSSPSTATRTGAGAPGTAERPAQLGAGVPVLLRAG